MKSGIMIVLSVILFIALGGLGYLVSVFNSLIQVKNNIGKAWHNIDVLLLQRNGQITKLIDVTKAYGNYEQGLMAEIVRLRKKYDLVKRTEQKTETENELAAKLRQVFGAGERYPDIKADVLYRNVQERISKLEEMIADRRVFFNDTVTIYNTRIEQVPQVFIARILRFKRHPLLELPERKKK